MTERRDHKIYKYTNKVNGKVYIGRTCNSLRKRAGAHGEGYMGCPYFYNAIKKYGWESFEPSIIEEFLTAQEASIKELEYIAEFDSSNSEKGYNVKTDDGSDFSEETRKKMSERNKGKSNPRWGAHLSEEHKERIRESNRNRVYTDEMRANASKAHKGINCGVNHPLFGKHRSDYVKQRVSQGTRKPVKCLETNKVYYSIKEASKMTGCNTSSISACCMGRIKSTKGIHWMYVSKDEN